ncbi:MAG: four helix bundle protein [Deltaproteobacteria bacterium HGW-Deltaproteobacteria-15]|nr:MAG: four helix bundle protein [Deltaproteobacteria bacterium HGW-Deltaproteobacteria-15]
MSNVRNPGRPTGSHRTDRSDQSDRTDRSEEAAHRDRTLRASGGYRKLRSFQVATVIYDATVSFCDRFVDKRSRTHDQMVQAARSGRQNIAEGSRASATSSQTELRLVNVARASLDELLLDYEDFLRQRGLTQWGKDDPRAQAVREVGKRSDRTNRSDQTDRSDWKAYAQWLSQPNLEVIANAIICLIHQANYLLDRQVAGLERQFIDEGGYSERLAAARIEKRREQPPMESQGPVCPVCGKTMALRIARKGKNAGSRFWGCCGYPECRGTRPMETSD